MKEVIIEELKKIIGKNDNQDMINHFFDLLGADNVESFKTAVEMLNQADESNDLMNKIKIALNQWIDSNKIFESNGLYIYKVKDIPTFRYICLRYLYFDNWVPLDIENIENNFLIFDTSQNRLMCMSIENESTINIYQVDDDGGILGLDSLDNKINVIGNYFSDNAFNVCLKYSKIKTFSEIYSEVLHNNIETIKKIVNDFYYVFIENKRTHVSSTYVDGIIDGSLPLKTDVSLDDLDYYCNDITIYNEIIKRYSEELNKFIEFNGWVELRKDSQFKQSNTSSDLTDLYISLLETLYFDRSMDVIKKHCVKFMDNFSENNRIFLIMFYDENTDNTDFFSIHEDYFNIDYIPTKQEFNEYFKSNF